MVSLHIDKPTIRYNKPLDILGFSGPWNPPKNVRSPSHRSLCPTAPRRWCLGISLPQGRVATPPMLAHPGARCRWLWYRPDHGLLPALTVETVFDSLTEKRSWSGGLLVTYFRQYQYFFLHLSYPNVHRTDIWASTTTWLVLHFTYVYKTLAAGYGETRTPSNEMSFSLAHWS